MARYHLQRIVRDAEGDVVPTVTVEVNQAGSETNQAIYSDAAGTPKSNPFTSGSDGRYDFWVDEGETIDLDFTKTGYTIPSENGVTVPSVGFDAFNNVLDYGALGDGTTDDTAAIQAAIDAGGEGGMTFLPNPSVAYLVSAPLQLPAYHTLMGANQYRTILKLADASNVNVIESEAVGVSRDDQILIMNLRIDGNRANQTTAGSGIVLTSEFCRLVNLQVLECFDHGVVFDGASAFTGASCHQVRAWNCGGDGFRSETGATDIILSNCIGGRNDGAQARFVAPTAEIVGCHFFGGLADTGSLGLVFEDLAKSVQVTGTIVEGSKTSAVKIDASTGSMRDFEFAGCQFRNPSRDGDGTAPCIEFVSTSGSIAGVGFSACSFGSNSAAGPAAIPSYIFSHTGSNDLQGLRVTGCWLRDWVTAPWLLRANDQVSEANNTYGVQSALLLSDKLRVRVTLSGNETVANTTDTDVPWDAVTYDIGTFWAAGSPTLLTVPADMNGLYAVYWQAQWATGGGTARRVRLMKNGSTVVAASEKNPHATKANQWESSHWLVALAEGDTLSFRVWQDSGGNNDIVAASTWAVVTMVHKIP